MYNNYKQEITLILATLGIFCVVIMCSTISFYHSMLRVSSEEVSRYLSSHSSHCAKLVECDLLPGDILIRRYINSRTIYFDKLLYLHFTHSAFYLGEGNLVEAIGIQKNQQNEVQITKLTESDWMDSGIESWVIIRPRSYNGKLEDIQSTLKHIALDPEYSFGLPDWGYKQVTCADLVASPLIKEGIISNISIPKIITPDYLFSLVVNYPDTFEIFAYRK